MVYILHWSLNGHFLPSRSSTAAPTSSPFSARETRILPKSFDHFLQYMYINSNEFQFEKRSTFILLFERLDFNHSQPPRILEINKMKNKTGFERLVFKLS